MNEKRLRSWLEGADGGNVSFDMADRLICRTLGPNLWHQDEQLSAVYGEMCRETDRSFPLFITPEVIEYRRQRQAASAKRLRALKKEAVIVVGEFIYRLGNAPVELAA